MARLKKQPRQIECFESDEKKIKTVDDLRLWNPFQRMSPTRLGKLAKQSLESDALDDVEDALL
jgi:hypothetical protein